MDASWHEADIPIAELSAPYPPAGPPVVPQLATDEALAWIIAGLSLLLAGYFATLRQSLGRSRR